MKLILFLALALPLVLSLFVSSDVPVCLWSNKHTFSGQNVNVPESLDKHDTLSFMKFALGQTKHNPLRLYVSDKSTTPEVVVLYLEPKLRTDSLSTYSSSFSKLKSILSSAKSSLTVPFVNVEGSLNDDIISSAVKVQEKQGKVIYIGKGSTLLPQLRTKVSTLQVVSTANLESGIGENSDIFTNGKADLIIVHLDQTADNLQEKLEQSNAIIERTQHVVEEATEDFISVYTGLTFDAPHTTELAKTQERRALLDISQVVPNASNNTNNTNGSDFFFTYFGGWFWEVLVLAIIATPILVSGIYAIEGIQSPDRFPKSKQH